jgi:hypothetical protein
VPSAFAELTGDEKKKAEARERLAASNYSLDGEHLVSSDELEAALKAELEDHVTLLGEGEAPTWSYSFAKVCALLGKDVC